MSVAIYIRGIETGLWLADFYPPTLADDLAAYRHEDMIFVVKLPKTGEIMRLDKYVAAEMERKVAA